LVNQIINNQSYCKIVSNFTKGGFVINSPQQIANEFNEYFVNIGKNLANSIKHCDKSFTSYLSNSPSNSLAMFFTNSHEIINILMSLKNKHSAGFDNIPVSIVKKCISIIAEPIASLVNCSFSTGSFPDKLKIAKVCPVFKNGADCEFENYRPISILPSFSQIFEKVAHDRLNQFLLSNAIIKESQYGFRSNHSTYMALLDMHKTGKC